MTAENENLIDLEAERVRFFSQNDEASFFAWIGKIPSVTKCEGRGRSIFLSIDSAAINEDDLRELISLFRRYDISMKQLAVFDRKPFSKWFHNRNAYWFDEVFSKKES